jgi:hypothetical protein
MDDDLDPREQLLAEQGQREWEEEEARLCDEALQRIRTGMGTAKDAEILDRNLRFK